MLALLPSLPSKKNFLTHIHIYIIKGIYIYIYIFFLQIFIASRLFSSFLIISNFVHLAHIFSCVLQCGSLSFFKLSTFVSSQFVKL